MEESKQAIAVAPKLGSDFPDFFGSDQFLQILRRNDVKALDQTQHPGDLLSMLIAEFVEKFLDRASPVRGPVELDRAHGIS